MRKKALLAAMMALVLLLSSCALVVKDEAVDNATEIIRMGDQVITKDKVKEQVELALYNASVPRSHPVLRFFPVFLLPGAILLATPPLLCYNIGSVPN